MIISTHCIVIFFCFFYFWYYHMCSIKTISVFHFFKIVQISSIYNVSHLKVDSLEKYKHCLCGVIKTLLCLFANPIQSAPVTTTQPIAFYIAIAIEFWAGLSRPMADGENVWETCLKTITFLQLHFVTENTLQLSSICSCVMLCRSACSLASLGHIWVCSALFLQLVLLLCT